MMTLSEFRDACVGLEARRRGKLDREQILGSGTFGAAEITIATGDRLLVGADIVAASQSAVRGLQGLWLNPAETWPLGGMKDPTELWWDAAVVQPAGSQAADRIDVRVAAGLREWTLDDGDVIREFTRKCPAEFTAVEATADGREVIADADAGNPWYTARPSIFDDDGVGHTYTVGWQDGDLARNTRSGLVYRRDAAGARWVLSDNPRGDQVRVLEVPGTCQEGDYISPHLFDEIDPFYDLLTRIKIRFGVSGAAPQRTREFTNYRGSSPGTDSNGDSVWYHELADAKSAAAGDFRDVGTDDSGHIRTELTARWNSHLGEPEGFHWDYEASCNASSMRQIVKMIRPQEIPDFVATFRFSARGGTIDVDEFYAYGTGLSLDEYADVGGVVIPFTTQGWEVASPWLGQTTVPSPWCPAPEQPPQQGGTGYNDTTSMGVHMSAGPAVIDFDGPP